MTPKEKAIDLRNKFIPLTRKWDEENGWNDDEYDAAECALVAVGEIYSNNTDESKNDYWIEVMREIEKL